MSKISNINNFENDIFISYSHLDNKPLIEGQKGWISSFHASLSRRLGQLLGREPKIWRDETEIRGHEYFVKVTMEKLRKSLILISVLTPRYIQSEWCMDELQEFCRVVKSSDAVSIRNQSRIFKIIKTPVPPEQNPAEIRQLLGYEFFEMDEKDNPREFIGEKDSRYLNDYLDKLNDVANDIRRLIKTIENNTESVTQPPEKTIYLAETTSDLKKERDDIRRNLLDKGFTILPNRWLPIRPEDGDFKDTVRDFLRQCKLTIHLIGNRYGSVPEEEEKSIIELQNKLAAEQCQNDPMFYRLIWIPPNLTPEKRQQDFINSLQNNKAKQPRTEIDQSALEDFKTLVQDTLKKITEPPLNRKAKKHDGPKRVYLICDQPDLELIQPIDDCLYNEGFEVLLPLFTGDEDQRFQIHLDYLCLCDVAMVYYNFANESWLSCKLNDLRKAPGYGRDKPIAASTVYITGKKTDHKERFRTREFQVIKKFESFAPDHLTAFISGLKNRNGGEA
ncbi:MAG: TIR domain-containing protein [Candidatus Hodarchaeota archaeon]